jgi:hypothetical protein
LSPVLLAVAAPVPPVAVHAALQQRFSRRTDAFTLVPLVATIAKRASRKRVSHGS